MRGFCSGMFRCSQAEADLYPAAEMYGNYSMICGAMVVSLTAADWRGASYYMTTLLYSRWRAFLTAPFLRHTRHISETVLYPIDE